MRLLTFWKYMFYISPLGQSDCVISIKMRQILIFDPASSNKRLISYVILGVYIGRIYWGVYIARWNYLLTGRVSCFYRGKLEIFVGPFLGVFQEAKRLKSRIETWHYVHIFSFTNLWANEGLQQDDDDDDGPFEMALSSFDI